jgi:diguanylate cyclase (GGDEF)-like protein
MKTILAVDDTKSNLNILLELLGEEYDLLLALNGSMALDILQEERVDLILLDIVMPNMDGFTLCKILKDDILTKDIPIIFLTSSADDSSIERAYDVGGSDYITKPFGPKELRARVRRELHIQDLQSKLKDLALKDSMTQLHNRRYFDQSSKELLDLSVQKDEPLSLFILDIDKFKRINDTYGHSVGDMTIIYLAKILKSFQREYDVVCRFGGEEFVMLLPNTDKNSAYTIANRLREDIESSSLDIGEDKPLKFTVSIGVDSVDTTLKNPIDRALSNADSALYVAKESGRNIVKIF